MKLASLKSGRDGRLVVVSNDLAWCADAGHIAPTLQAALDGWDWIAPALRNLATDLAHGMIPKERFHERAAASPLPRAYLLLHTSPEGQWVQGRSDHFCGARDPIDPDMVGMTAALHAGTAIVTGDVPRGAAAQEVTGLVRLVGLMHSLVHAGGQHICFSPVFVTPDALGGDWQDGLTGTLCIDINGAPQSRDNAGPGFGFADAVAKAAATRALTAGTLVTVTRAVDALKPGDTLRIWMDDTKRHSIFGALERQA